MYRIGIQRNQAGKLGSMRCALDLYPANPRSEDMDVRMLGGGRPFVLEVLNARELPLSRARCEQLQVRDRGARGAVGLGHRLTV